MKHFGTVSLLFLSLAVWAQEINSTFEINEVKFTKSHRPTKVAPKPTELEARKCLFKSLLKLKKKNIIFLKITVMIERFVRDMIEKGQYEILSRFLRTASKVKIAEYQNKCLQRFRSRAICITKTKPFFIWQKMEAEKLWTEIVGNFRMT